MTSICSGPKFSSSSSSEPSLIDGEFGTLSALSASASAMARSSSSNGGWRTVDVLLVILSFVVGGGGCDCGGGGGGGGADVGIGGSSSDGIGFRLTGLMGLIGSNGGFVLFPPFVNSGLETLRSLLCWLRVVCGGRR